MKKYPLDIENVGSSTYILMSRGHHDFEAFMDAVVKEYPDWPMGKPCHLWVKATPNSEGETVYNLVSEHTRGAFPITHCQEDSGHEVNVDRLERLKRLFTGEQPSYIKALISNLTERVHNREGQL